MLVAAVLFVSVPAGAFDALLSGSASADYRYIFGPNPPQNPSPFGIEGLTLEVAQKVVAEVGKGVSFSVKACGGCHGFELDQGYGELHVKRFFNARAGRINVPFGEFTVRHDPMNYTTASKPMPYAMGDMLNYGRQGFNLGIVPAPWVDNGAEVFGSFSLGEVNALDYSAYVVKGLVGDNDFDFAASRSYLDNNKTPAFGARLVLTGPDWSLGGSISAGTYNRNDTLWYVMGGAELYFRAGPVVVRAEALARRTDIDPSAPYDYALIDPWFLKLGWYVQLDVTPIPALVLVLRTDGVHRLGMPLPGSELAPSAGAQRQTASGLFRITEQLMVKASYELWTFTGTPYSVRHVVRGGLVFGY
jgi:hypothetical protein